MTNSKIKSELIEKISSMKSAEIKKIYGFIENEKNKTEDFEDWNNINEEVKNKITQGINDLNEGRKQDAHTYLKMVKKKYGINA